MAQDAVAKRYAEALVELGEEHDKLESFADQLEGVVRLLDDSAEFRHLLRNPGIEAAERREAIRRLGEAIDLDRMMVNFLFILLDNDRVAHLPEIQAAFHERLDRQQNRVRAQVTSAVALEGSEKEKLRSAISEMTGKDVELTTEVDESLIGGAVTRIGGTVYDGSVRTQLEQLKDNILTATKGT
jgi:F-type H+-transporting ATPase subunit delta